ncbi:MAG: hypothetical protein LBM62_03245 [Mediterranea sp.]|jgi:alpha-N-arabinofuranosidase|nr:hypothetical protein [Mediterranea sp.]
MKKILFTLFALWGLLTTASAQDKDFHIYLCIGQSNMEGNARLTPEDKVGVSDRFRMMSAVDCPDLGREQGQWYTAVPPLARCNTGLNPDDNFGRSMVSQLPKNIKVGVVMVAIGGCKIQLFDKNDCADYIRTAPDWMLSAINAYGGNPYKRLIDLAKQAQKDGVIKGILMHQGESNINEQDWPQRVKNVYENILSDLNLNAADVPLIAGEVVHAEQRGISASMNDIIDRLPQTIPTAHVVSSKGCTAGPDNLHFNTAGYMELGKRYAIAMLNAKGVKHNLKPTALSAAPAVSKAKPSGTPKLVLQLDEANTTVSPMLYGLMTEEINYAYEGGLYAQLIRNPSFMDVAPQQRRRQGGGGGGFFGMRAPKPPHWNITDSITGEMSVAQNVGINDANPRSLCLLIKENKPVGVINEGFWGFPIRPNTTYKGSLWVKSNAASPTLNVALESLDGTTVFAQTQVTGAGEEWKKLSFTIQTPDGITPTKDARFRISASSLGRYWFTRVTLFPPTFNDRPNGLRQDIMTMMKNMKPQFLRFPGGNYLEGNNFANRFNWKETIGDPDTRPGHLSPWGYRSTDGLGLLEFLTWAEDIGAEPLVGLFAGYVLNRDYVKGEFLKPFIQDALDEIEYVIGGTNTKWGAQRARDGHPEPFKLTYVEIGNEDWFDQSGSYTERYKMFYDAIKAKYPQLQIISSIGGRTNMGSTMNVPGVQLDIIDEHYYRDANDMYRNANQYDSYDRNGPKIFCGEWATREGKPTTNMNAALGDAAWMTGMERNSDIVIMHCYAPLFVNVNPGGMQWESDLIGYDALNAYGSPAYYAQVMFANHVGDKVVPIQASNIPTFDLPLTRMDSLMRRTTHDQASQLYYVSTKDTKTGTVYLKVVNVEKNAQRVAISLQGRGSVNSKAVKIEMKGTHPEDTNSIDNPTNIVPVTSTARVGKSFNYTFPPYSITVLQFETK